MAWIEQRRRADGGLTARVFWRPGGCRDTPREWETFGAPASRNLTEGYLAPDQQICTLYGTVCTKCGERSRPISLTGRTCTVCLSLGLPGT